MTLHATPASFPMLIAVRALAVLVKEGVRLAEVVSGATAWEGSCMTEIAFLGEPRVTLSVAKRSPSGDDLRR